MSDLISRQDTINEIKNVFDDVLCGNIGVRKGLPEAIKRIEMMPSAEPKTKCVAQIRIDRDDIEDIVNKKVNEIVDKMVEPRTGKWIPVTKVYKPKADEFPNMHIEWEDATEPDEIDALKCSECGEVFDFYDARNWCTQCGADMRGDKHE